MQTTGQSTRDVVHSIVDSPAPATACVPATALHRRFNACEADEPTSRKQLFDRASWCRFVLHFSRTRSTSQRNTPFHSAQTSADCHSCVFDCLHLHSAPALLHCKQTVSAMSTCSLFLYHRMNMQMSHLASSSAEQHTNHLVHAVLGVADGGSIYAPWRCWSYLSEYATYNQAAMQTSPLLFGNISCQKLLRILGQILCHS